ncbi:MAG: flavin-containing monooxygenase [Porticoccaceae bacterium]
MPVQQSDFFEVIIIGAGQTGMYELIKMREIGASVKVIESGGDVGGAWYWNRYPGCRLDSECYSYGYSFSKEVLDEWSWSELFTKQEENLRYYNFVADKYDLRRDIQFNTTVTKAAYDEEHNLWRVTLDDGSALTCRFLLAATGPLSAVQMPNIPGIDDFKGDSWHTAHWPQDPNGFGGQPYDFRGKKVGVIGTGSTGVQVIQETSKTAKELFVFQRSGNWCAPLGNKPLSREEMEEIRASYPDIFAKCKATAASFIHDAIDKSVFEATEEEREAFFEKVYWQSGFGIWFGTYNDVLSDREANKILTDFVARKIRQRVKDPVTAEKLIPKDHGFGIRRVPLETNYYECYNQDNVHLVDLKETPVERITANGIKTIAKEYDLDVIIYATGFDAITGALKRIDIRGIGGQSLKEKWSQGPLTYLGAQTVGFPNFFTLVGPHSGASFCNIPRCIEDIVEWVSDFIDFARKQDVSYIEPLPESEKQWTQQIYEDSKDSLFAEVDSWFTGKNYNDPDAVKTFLLYLGGGPQYRQLLADIKSDNYSGFVLR